MLKKGLKIFKLSENLQDFQVSKNCMLISAFETTNVWNIWVGNSVYKEENMGKEVKRECHKARIGLPRRNTAKVRKMPHFVTLGRPRNAPQSGHEGLFWQAHKKYISMLLKGSGPTPSTFFSLTPYYFHEKKRGESALSLKF